MFAKLKQRIRKLIRIADCYDEHRRALKYRIEEAERVIRERTDIHVDAAMHQDGTNQIIMVGRYRNRDYVEVCSVPGSEFKCMIEMLHGMKRFGNVRTVDAIAGWKAVIERDINL